MSWAVFAFRLHVIIVPCSVPTMNLVGIVGSYSRHTAPRAKLNPCKSLFGDGYLTFCRVSLLCQVLVLLRAVSYFACPTTYMCHQSTMKRNRFQFLTESTGQSDKGQCGKRPNGSLRLDGHYFFEHPKYTPKINIRPVLSTMIYDSNLNSIPALGKIIWYDCLTEPTMFELSEPKILQK